MRDRLHDRFSGVVWAWVRPDLGFTLLLFKSLSAFELSWCELPSSERLNSTFVVSAGDHRRRPNPALVFGLILCCSIFCYGCMFAFVACFSFQY